jgi:hypothetical protein
MKYIILTIDELKELKKDISRYLKRMNNYGGNKGT